MREYEKRIREHKSRLPHIREQITAALVLFVVASLMLTVVTFSWLTLSTAPEVSNTSLSISANGNLEIALARDIMRDNEGNPILDSNGNVIPIAPGASEVGDSVKDLLDRNTTWGNLVNLSDEIYGLENIVLRPATLNTNELLSRPLFAAKYDDDGRIIELRSDFAYTQWDSTLGRFQASSNKGVKAISSVKFDDVKYDNPLLGAYDKKIENTKKTLEQARLALNSLASSPNMLAIDGLMSTYMNGTLRNKLNAEPCSVQDIEMFYEMMLEVYNGPVKTMGNAFMEIIELYQLDTYGQKNSTELNYERFTDLDVFCAEITEYISVMNNDRANLKDANGNPTPKRAIVIADDIPELLIYLEDRAQLKKYIDELEGYKGNDTTWGNIKHIVNYVVDIDSCEINGKTVSTLTGDLKTYGSELLGMIGEGKANKNSAVVKQGLMQRLDLMLHNGVDGFKINKATITIEKVALKTRIENSSMSSLSSMVDWVIKGETGIAEANITTNARKVSASGTMQKNVDNAFEIVGAQSVVKTYVARDTHGLSIDFWVRTNSLESFLVLEGTVIYNPVDITKTITLYNEAGEPTVHKDVPIYTAEVTVSTELNGETSTSVETDREVFEINGVWYLYEGTREIGKPFVESAGNGQERTVTVTINNTPVKKQDRVAVGYTGANRIWTEEELEGMSESEFRTTQGAGSCYTYYADPSEKAQINQVLSALKIAFVSADGQILANARLATEFCFSEYGQHTVPIMLEESAMDTGTVDANGDVRRAITTLEKNEATLITAIIYLDGNEVTNDKVLSFSNIEGSFNIQFGSTQNLDSIPNEELMGEQMMVSANVTGTNGTTNPTVDYFEGMDKEGYKTTVTLTIDGEQPTSVYAYFLRKISATQGTKQEKITFTKKAGTTDQWVAEASFYSPGIYVMRSVIVDGIERDISTEEPPTVTINGFSCNNFHGTNGQSYVYRTADNSASEKFYVNISAKDDGLLPNSVEALFQSEDGKSVTVTFTDTDRDTLYEGTAIFRSSGTYTCKYLIIDGEYYELASEQVREVYTGLKVAVWLSLAEGDSFDDVEEMVFSTDGYQYIHKGSSHRFNVQMKIFDNEGNAIEELTNVNLYYSRDTDATLRWDPSSKYYVGQLPIISTPGYYTFEYAEVGHETINKAKSTMYIRSIPSDPVSYVGIDGAVPEQVIAISGYQGEEQPEAKVALKFLNADSAMIFGKFSKTTAAGTTYVIIPAKNRTRTDGNVYEFALPDEDGIWKLEEIKMSMVYDGETGTFFMGDNSIELLFKVNEGEGEKDYVPVMIGEGTSAVNVWDAAQDYYVVEPESEWTKTLLLTNLDRITPNLSYSGKALMDHYTLTDKVTVDHVFNGVDGVTISVSGVTLTYAHSKSDKNVSWTGDTDVPDIVKTLSQNGKEFTMPATSTLYLPGQYQITLSYELEVNGQTYRISRNVGQFTLSYTMPTVTITGITPTPESGAYSYDVNAFPTDPSVKDGCDNVYSAHADHKHNAFTSSFDAYNAKVYFACFHPGGKDYGTSRQDHYYIKDTVQADGTYGNPSVTITLAGMGNNFDSATLNFYDKDNKLANTNICKDTTYSKGTLWGYHVGTSGANTPYSWTANGAVRRYVGQINVDTTMGGGNSKTAAGILTAEVLTVKVGSETFSIKIPKITIDNSY